jgi:tetratricopeptide (TPR) repeat protein
VVLLLSRRQSDAPDFAHRRTLSVLPQDQGIMLLQELAGPRAADRPCVEQLVQHIGGYPLALQLIGSYLSSQQEEIGDYLRWFEHEGLTTVNFGEHQAQSVPVLLQRTYDALAQSSQHVFLLLGLLAAAPFPLELVQDILELPEHTVRQALGSLINLSVLRRPDRNYEVSHPLIHTFAMEHLSSQVHAASSPSPDTITRWQEQFLITLTTHFKQSNPYDRNNLALWYPHVLPLVSAEHLTVQQGLVAAGLFNAVGFGAITQGKYEQAEPLFQRALAISEQQVGAQHPDTASSLNNLALLYQDQGKSSENTPDQKGGGGKKGKRKERMHATA